MQRKTPHQFPIQDEIAEKWLRFGARGTREWCSMAFPERFTFPFSPALHDPLFEALDGPEQQVLVLAPREMGKTTTVGVGYASWRILYGLSRFVLMVCASADKAAERTEDLKQELADNSIIRGLFGSQESDHWNKDGWVTAGGARVVPIGAGQRSLRGQLTKQGRPDLVIVDDLENDEDVMNPESRKKLKNWFYGALMKTLPRAQKHWKLVVIGTLLHEDSLLANLAESSHWKVVRLEMCDEHYRSHWPAKWPDGFIQREVEEHREMGMLDVFFRERRNIVISTETATFKREMFKYFDEAEAKLDENPNIVTVVLVDPAKSVGSKSDANGIVVASLDRSTARVYVRQALALRAHYHEMHDKVIELAREYKARRIAMETTSLVDYAVGTFTERLRQRGIPESILHELKARNRDKETRIASLAPLYHRGQIFHNKHMAGALEEQLMMFPRARKDDVMDVFAYVVELLMEGGEFGFEWIDPDGGSREEIEAEFEGLEKSMTRMAPLRNWRVA